MRRFRIRRINRREICRQFIQPDTGKNIRHSLIDYLSKNDFREIKTGKRITDLQLKSHKIAGWMKQSASTEYSSNGGTATLVPPYGTAFLYGLPALAIHKLRV